MELDAILTYCQAKPGAVETLPFGPWPVCFKVGGKIFAQVYPDKITLKCTRFAGERLREAYPGVVVRGYHCPPVQQPYWNTIFYEGFPKEELPNMIGLAYETVVNALPKAVREEIAGGNP